MTQAQSAPENKMTDDEIIDSIGAYEYGWHDSDAAGASARRGLNEDVVRDISAKKGEPEWMLNQRLKALNIFDKKPVPTWGADLSGIDFDQIKYYVKSTEEQAQTWEDLPDDIKATYDKLGIPEAEKQRLVAGDHGRRHALRWPARRRSGGRNRVQLARPRPPRLRGRDEPRLQRAPRDPPALLPARDHRQHDG